jgi:carbon storage regulator
MAMVVLARKVNESNQAGNVEVRILKIRGSQVRLGLTAPSEVEIWRSELLLVKEEAIAN